MMAYRRSLDISDYFTTSRQNYENQMAEKINDRCEEVSPPL